MAALLKRGVCVLAEGLNSSLSVYHFAIFLLDLPVTPADWNKVQLNKSAWFMWKLNLYIYYIGLF